LERKTVISLDHAMVFSVYQAQHCLTSWIIRQTLSMQQHGRKVPYFQLDMWYGSFGQNGIQQLSNGDMKINGAI
jgi:hypothetical protein